MVRKYGTSLRWRIVFLNIGQHLSPQEIVRLLKVSKTFVHYVLKLYRETKGVDYSANRNSGKRRSVVGIYFVSNRSLCAFTANLHFVLQDFACICLFSGRDILLVRRLMGQYPELYLDELRDWIEFLTGEAYSIPTLSRCMQKIGLSIKKVSFFSGIFSSFIFY